MARALDYIEKQKLRVLKVLTDCYPVDLPQNEIARRAGMTRFTAAKYLRELVGGGKIEERRIGNVALFKISRKKMK